MEIGTVRRIDIDREMQSAYMDYAMSVIVSRALPDVRDGLKPVHRRILYAMHDMGLRPDRPYKKSARIVGEVLGKYHPHGDAAVYEAMARMAQNFSLRYMLVDGQGNFGSIDGDSPAAMRYTEARMAPITEEMLADIGKETVDFVPNFDDTLAEPSVLPAVLPNLLVNGASGIAVGMTTSIPPHNLGEVCEALIYLIDNYKKLDEITIEDLARFVQGPDFPTGGVVYRYAEQGGDGERTDLLRNAYALGRGRLTVQAQVHIEEMSRNRSRIVITELPYQVNKTRLIERIADLVRDGKIEGITDLRDESDRQGMRICIELTRTVEPREVLAHLFRMTPMQTTFSLRMLALVDGEPRLLPLKRALIHYLEHRQEIITRRSRYLLERARLRAHILEGLLKALDQIDQVIDTIRRSRTPDSARSNLMKRFTLSELQAQAILDMPLKRLSALERRQIADEHEEKLREAEHLQGLLRSPTKIRTVIRDDLWALKKRYGDPRRTRIVDQEKGHHTARDLVEAEDIVVTLWHDGQLSRTAGVPRVSSKAIPVSQMWGSTRDDVVVFAASGQAVLVPLHQLAAEQNTPVSSIADLDRAEALIGALVVPHPPAGQELPAAYLALVSRGGRIKRVTVQDLASATSRGATTVMNVDEGDQLGWVAETSGEDHIILATRQGKAIRFAESDVRPMGLSAAGVLAIRLGSDDAVVGMGVARDGEFLVLFTEKGCAKRTAIEDFSVQKRYGGGVQAARLSGRSGLVAVATVANESQDVALITAGERVTRLPVKAIRALSRSATGQRSRADTKESYVEPDKHGSPTRLTVLAGAQGASSSTEAGAQNRASKARKARSKTTKRKATAKTPAQGGSASESSRRKPMARRSRSKQETAAPNGSDKARQMPLPLDEGSAKSSRRGGTSKQGTTRSTPDAES
jgi:DNA gyrase subunit A